MRDTASQSSSRDQIAPEIGKARLMMNSFLAVSITQGTNTVEDNGRSPNR